MSTEPAAPAWYVISLRPQGEHGGVRRAAARAGAGVIAPSPWRLQPRDDPGTRAALAQALRAPRVVFTSPAAVRAAAMLQPLRAEGARQWFAVGAGTAAALRRRGIAQVQAPSRMDSEGLLDLPGLRGIEAGSTLGLVTAPGGRGVLQPALQARGARVLRAEVYAREPVAPSARAQAELATLAAPAAVLLSSGEALRRVLDALPAPLAQRLRGTTAVAASGRLAALAREQGFAAVALADGPRPQALVAAAAASVGAAIR
jgi:uroporphyrinogen-III synthase